MSTQDVVIRWSHLKAFGQSPAHAKMLLDGDENERTVSRTRGTALHAVVLGTARVVTSPDDAPKRPTAAQRNAKKPSPASVEAIAFWDAFDREHANDHVVTRPEYEKVMRMAESIGRNAIAVDMLRGTREETLHFKLFGRNARATPDVCAADFSYVTELKTGQTAQPQRFTWQALRYGYHGQLAMQGAAVHALHGIMPACNIVAVESSKPYPVTCFSLTPRAIDQGARMMRLYMEQLLACEASGEWPAYAQSVLDLDVPDDEVELDWTGTEESEAA